MDQYDGRTEEQYLRDCLSEMTRRHNEMQDEVTRLQKEKIERQARAAEDHVSALHTRIRALETALTKCEDAFLDILDQNYVRDRARRGRDICREALAAKEPTP